MDHFLQVLANLSVVIFVLTSMLNVGRRHKSYKHTLVARRTSPLED
jgi:hypothetical protein